MLTKEDVNQTVKLFNKAEYMDRGYFTVRETPVDTNHGIQISFTTKITGKGQQWLTRKMLDAGLLKAVGSAA
ncbi:phage antirepressor KilAC domain-containing protein [Symbiopectobacterium purcellii]|uniref:phage antirepressor KilAC domain-containing protein n=1 Tax=Symbiopectobacterium purcellii TaxID=2871826 RepID=UPI003F82A0E2